MVFGATGLCPNQTLDFKSAEVKRKAIEAMCSVSELKQTRVYRDAMDEGRPGEAQALVLRLLAHHFGTIPSKTET